MQIRLCVRLGLAGLFVAIGINSAFAQATIEVIASQQRDGVDVGMSRTGAGIAADGAIVFIASTSSVQRELFLAEQSSMRDLGVSAYPDAQINADSIVFIGASGVSALSRTNASTSVQSLFACSPGTPCPSVLSLADNGRVAFSALDGGPGIYLGQVSNGALNGTAALVPKPPGFISTLKLDIDSPGDLLVNGDYQGMREVYGAFRRDRTTGNYTTIFSTRDGPNAGNGNPWAVKLGRLGAPFVLAPEQLSLTGTRDLNPGIFTSSGVPYGSLAAFGTNVLPLSSVNDGSMDVNEAGRAMVVAQLTSGWSGLFSLDTTIQSPSPVALLELHAQLQSCQDTPVRMIVVGINAAGQSVVKAQVQTPSGVDNQLWRVTPSPSFSFSYCHLQLKLLPRRPFERWLFLREPLPYEVLLPPVLPFELPGPLTAR
jgi:hypothetical protein